MKYKKFKKLIKRWENDQSQIPNIVPEYHYLESSFTNIDPNTPLANVTYDTSGLTTTSTGMDSFVISTGQSEYYQRGIINVVDQTPIEILYDWLETNYPITGEAFADFQTQCFELFMTKHKSYGPNNLIRETTELTAEGIMLRVKDKLNRINNLIHNGADGENESVADSLMDIVNYTTILYIILQGKWGK